jgi:arylsulfatase A-like enzyme
MLPTLQLQAALVSFAVLAAVSPTSASAEPARKPNVVLVMTDDQGYGDLGLHGNTMIRTPNLDTLARECARFTNFHVDPTCSETRSALMTGRYSTRVGVWHTIMGRSILRRDETTMADVFHASGYRTGIFGKWHLGDNYPFRPQDRGFDEVLIHGGGGVTQTPDYWGNDYFDDTYFHNGKPEPQEGYCTDVFFRAAMRFIEANRDRPFFCYLPTNAPHGPFNVAEKYSAPYVEQGVPQPMANFYGMISNIDENIGRLTAHLDKLGLAENTILIFMTDNGTAAGVARSGARRRAADDADRAKWNGYSAGMRGQKGSQYEGGHRVPCFVRWPAGGIGGDREIEVLSAHIDLLPTLIDLCALTAPTDVNFDGASRKPLLLGTPDADKTGDRALVVNSQRVEIPEKWRKSAVMTQRWRLVDGRELYDIQADPGQEHNVAAQHADVVGRLRGVYEGWWDEVSRRFDEYSRIVVGNDAQNPTTLTCHDWHADISQVPWSQAAVRNGPLANGVWAIDVEQAGTYRITLRRWPQGVEGALPAKQSRVKIGDVEAMTAVADGAESAVLTLELPVGEAMLQTWLEQADGKSRGAFFVTFERLP